MARQPGGGCELPGPQGETGQDVPTGLGQRGYGQLAGGVLDAGIGAQAACAGDVSQASEVMGLLVGQDRGAGEAITDHRVVQGELGYLGKVFGQPGQLCGIGQAEQADSSGADGAAQQPVAGGGVVDPQQLFADS